MTPKERAAMQQALVYFEAIANGETVKPYEVEDTITALREALAEPVKLAISEEAFNWIDANAPMFVRKALAEPQITTPDVCGEVCVRAKLCYGCNKNLEEANAKYAEQAEQEQKPVALLQLAEDALVYHTEQTRPIQNTIDALAAIQKFKEKQR